MTKKYKQIMPYCKPTIKYSRAWHPRPPPGRADLRVRGRAGDVEHAQLGEGGGAAAAAEACVVAAAAAGLARRRLVAARPRHAAA